jgi:hypothetical protein
MVTREAINLIRFEEAHPAFPLGKPRAEGFGVIPVKAHRRVQGAGFGEE